VAALGCTGQRWARAGDRVLREDVVVDVHCHVFSAADLPIAGFVAHLIPGLTELSRDVWRFPERAVRAVLAAVAALPNSGVPAPEEDARSFREALATGTALEPVPELPAAERRLLLDGLVKLLRLGGLVDAGKRELIGRYADTLYTVSHGRGRIAASLARAYPTVDLFTPCLVDFDRWSEDAAKTDLSVQIVLQGEIARLSTRGLVQRPTARFHPFVAFDPRREIAHPSAPRGSMAPLRLAAVGPRSGALDMVHFAVETAGFLGVKVYPPVGFAPLDNVSLRRGEPDAAQVDAALRALYTYCQAREVPITAHTSPGNEYGLGFRELVAPRRWRPVLREYPGLRLNLGHFGHVYGVHHQHGVDTEEAWCNQAGDLIQRYPSVYADLSNSPAVYDGGYAARYARYLRALVAKYPKIKQRLMYGSDWWLNRLDEGSDRFPTAIPEVLVAAGLTADEVRDVMGRNALRFLGFLDDRNVIRAGAAASRLGAFYATAGAARPIWLA
jgi:predicted TIM-barrel fold metal-dependent hydrolase